ncbi:BMP family ABC transporter substrate-binding protein [Actinomycetaceae bacterium WB03_NA08]|uniref:BMP family ABC transporter substrate-binding protein n=1 Tax=Scrofimicrobium canadense TaxID=2652290 RepID=A0A6N7VR80_9ACTO|nr:BMP family ABC transporter substrate-binding protein [Scrofimicrobium canadense]MSS84254.1 BMP family ABC transporter substrate-binding protein [Scrofimicrobium canadense]
MKNSVKFAAIAAIGAIALSACGAAPEKEAPASGADQSGSQSGAAAPTTGENIKACVVSDEGGFEDRSFNQSAHEGLLRAESELGVEIAQAESGSPDDFDPNIQNMVQENCDLIIGVGFMLQDAMIAAAQANPDIKFALVDSTFVKEEGDKAPENARALVFNTAEASYLAGYASAAMSKTGKVGAYVGMKLPTTAIFNDGFADGVKAYNEAKGTSVELLGWDKDKQDGMIVGDFSNQQKGKELTEQLFQQGADIVMPVAGQAGLGTLAAAKEKEGSMVVWVDADGAEAQPESAAVILTSVMKEIDNAVFDTIQSVLEGTFDSTDYIGTLANGGVGLAPWHDFESQVPAELNEEISALQEKIISGEIKVETTNQP